MLHMSEHTDLSFLLQCKPYSLVFILHMYTIIWLHILSNISLSFLVWITFLKSLSHKKQMLKPRFTFDKLKEGSCPGPMTPLTETSSRTPKGHGFNPKSGHIPRLRVPSWGACGRHLIVVSHINVSFSLSSFLSL